MDNEKMKELRAYYDSTSLTKEIAEAALNTETDQSPMIGITVRLPKAVLDKVRELASADNVKTTALVRRWVEEKVDTASEAKSALRFIGTPATETAAVFATLQHISLPRAS